MPLLCSVLLLLLQEAVDFVGARLDQGMTPAQAASALLDACLANDPKEARGVGCDNMTSVVVQLKSAAGGGGGGDGQQQPQQGGGQDAAAGPPGTGAAAEGGGAGEAGEGAAAGGRVAAARSQGPGDASMAGAS